MSAALVHKSLELLENDYLSRSGKRKTKGALDLIPEGHRTLKTIKFKGKKEKHSELSKSSKLTLTEAKDSLKLKRNNAEENLRKLNLLSSSKIDTETASKLFDRALLGRVVPIKEVAPIEEGTVFTEEDFEKFEKEYFCS